ncbi:hypothetical protein M406DRAFT_221605, partial [Cryphonectria parasitica EP155]
SLARAFTTRRAKVFGGDGEGRPTRSNTVRTKISGPGPKISAPTELIHTTNMLSYDAPDIHKEPKTATSYSSMSLGSEGDSDRSPTAASSPPTSPDSAFPHGGDLHDDDKSPVAPEPNHLSCYFTLPGQTSTVNAPAVPAIPKRAPSHTKRSFEPLSRRTDSLSRKASQSSRSVSSKASGTFSRASSNSTNTTASSPHTSSAYHAQKTSAKMPPPVPAALSSSSAAATKEPFGHELAQVTELAEEFALKAADKSRAIATQEEKDLASRGLYKFSPEEYVSDIQSLFSTFFGGE